MTNTIFSERRRRLLDQLGDGVAVLPSAVPVMKNGHHEFRFRQDSNFYYFSGFNEPQCILVLIPGVNGQEIHLFLRPSDAHAEMWTGKRLGITKAIQELGIDKAYNINDFEKIFAQLIQGKREIYIDGKHHPNTFNLINSLLNDLRTKKKGPSYPSSLIDIDLLVGPMRQIKDQYEIEQMRESQRIAAMAHRAAMACTRPGISEGKIRAVLEYIFYREGAQGEAYLSIVAGGNNANILHYVENNQELKGGDLLLIDAGPEYNYYASDITRTFPVSGKFSSAQKIIYEIVLDTQNKVIEHTKPGVSLNELHDLACKSLILGLIDLKILKGSVDQNFSEQTFVKYYPHGTGHWLGLETHDVGEYKTQDRNNYLPLGPGMVFTVEPGLYFDENDESVPKEFRGIGVRIEDDILVTKVGYDNLSSDVPKSIVDVEKACEVGMEEFVLF